MKTKTIITELTKDDLVNLLCTATYGSNWLAISAPSRAGVVVEESDCREDIWAKALLAGNLIECTDYYAEGDAYGTLPHKTDEEGNVTYFVNLQDIIDGLQKCADGTFLDADNDNADRYLLTCLNTFKEDDGGIDQPQAEALMQIVLFNELIYG